MSAVLSDSLRIPACFVEAEHTIPYRYDLIDQYSKLPLRVETFEDCLDYYRFPRGDLAKIQRVFAGIEIDDKRVCVPFDVDLRFTGKLRDEQKRLVREWLGYGYGMIQSPPRTGKTVMLTALICKLRQRTLMLAHREDLCAQLEETIRAFTNVDELEQQLDRKLVGVLEDWDDFFPVATLSTYQCFAVSQQGRRVLDQHRDDFGLVIVDEAHVCKTELYNEVVERTTAAYRCGVTATPTRKDRMHCVVNDVLGPVVTVGTGEQLSVDYTWEYTGCDVPEFKNWTVMWNRLVKRKRRDKKIAERVVQDVRDGHYVLVTTERLKHLYSLEFAIQAIDPDITIGILSGSTKDRDGFRNAARRGEYQVVIAMNKIVELGYNVPRWSCFHNTLPMANAQNWYQRISRIRTPMEPAFKGDDWVKPTPTARIWLDSGHPAVFAYRNIVKKENDRLGFQCLNPEVAKPRGRRKGLGFQRKSE